MSIQPIHKKIVLATFIALGMAACGGGGGGSPSTGATSNVQMRSVQAEPVLENVSANPENAATGTKTSINVDTIKLSLGGKEHDLSKVQQAGVVDLTETARAYRQAYSVVAGSFAMQPTGGGDPEVQSPDMKMPLHVGFIGGEATQTLPTSGKYAYNGAAFDQNEVGQLSYNVDFDKRVGSGQVSGMSVTGNIELKEAKIGHNAIHNDADGSLTLTHSIQGKTRSDLGEGDYHVSFFGPNAEEVAGMVYHQKGEIGVAGKR